MHDLSRLFMITTIFGFFGCGSSGKVGPLKMTKPASQNISSGAASALADGCTSAACPKADVVVEVNGTRTSAITAQVGQSATYAVKARSTQFPGRLFSVLAMTPSPPIASMGILAAQSSISWLPLASDATSGSVQLRIRDLTRCQKLSQPAVAGNCAMANASLPEFDSVSTVPFSLTNAIASSIPTTPASTGGSAGGGLGGGLGGILGGLLGQGGGLGGIVGGGGGNVGGGNSGGIGGGGGNVGGGNNGGGNNGGSSSGGLPPVGGGNTGSSGDTTIGGDEEFP